LCYFFFTFGRAGRLCDHGLAVVGAIRCGLHPDVGPGGMCVQRRRA
jgi:hypothetical protein